MRKREGLDDMTFHSPNIGVRSSGNLRFKLGELSNRGETAAPLSLY